MTVSAADFGAAIKSVTKEWTRQRRAEERHLRSRDSREYVYSDRVNFTEVAQDILHAGYAHASGHGRYTVDRRQFYYAVRDQFLEATGREITYSYFAKDLLVRYMNRHPDETAGWKITASPRGTLTIPNTGYDTRIPCGTVAVEEHLGEAAARVKTFAGLDLFPVEWPSLAEGQRYQAVLYIEKEGFDPQLREARLAERFDLAIVSCKGQSVVAARMFADHVCRAGGGVPLLAAHDLDKYGFEIAQRLTTISDHMLENDLVKYEFKNAIDVVDLGLRLGDVEAYGLKSEKCRFKGHFPPDSIATPEEQEFLRSGRRVELNAFTAPQFIEWLESKLSEHLPGRLIPDDDVLGRAYRRAVALAEVNHAVRKVRRDAIVRARGAEVPASLRRRLTEALKDSPEAWDRVLYDLVASEHLSPPTGS
jgi:hypothetical protein